MAAASLFASTFFLVLFLGLQSLFVNAGHIWLAFFNSVLIGASHLVLYKLAPDAAGIEIVAYLSGGPFGVVSAIKIFGWWKRRPVGHK